MRTGTLLAIFLFIVAAGLFAYSMILTSHMESSTEPGSRPPIQDLDTPKEEKPPLVDSNVPPADK